ncbi:acetylornithine deacetylase [Pelistega europaea]|uniref:Acetylornithine deacetylase n=1 Tax=Pelistega europaea TaxID=106147 RepID=A0A7Y4P521_9BURK|nr:acetylornithine deacetylase [Pelistega europaea]NOL50071.1 acetylornithine deacetylase [Pelistega europaea]
MNTQQWLKELVSFDTTSRYSNLELIDRVRSYFDRYNLPSWITKNSDGTKANLFATLPAYDGNTQGGIVLSGHTDVVPVDGQEWDTDPFVLTEKEGKLYGRGTCDMKGFLASALALLPEFIQQKRKKPLHFAFSYDEELGCVGAPLMIDELVRRQQQIEGCVVGEPTHMRVIVAHKGSSTFTCHVHGRAAHGSLTPLGCNAVEHAARLICHIQDVAEMYRQNGPFDNDYDVPFTTLSSNMIQGGTASNIIPSDCSFTYEVRNLPGVPMQQIQSKIEDYIHQILLPRMRTTFPEANIDITVDNTTLSLEASEQAAITALVRALTQDNKIRKVGGGTEAGLFEKIGIPSIVCGPGNLDQAHKPNEFIELTQLVACDNFLRKLVASLQ